MKIGQHNKKCGEPFVCVSNIGYFVAYVISVINIVYTIYCRENVKNNNRCSEV